MLPPSTGLEALGHWLTSHGVSLDPRLRLVQRSRDGSTAVDASSSIPSGQTLARIPLSLVLSHRSSRLAHLLGAGVDPLASHAPALRLAVHVAYELALRERSSWATYLATCPALESIPIALLWTGESRRWSQGTELAEECARINVNETFLARFYDEVIVPLLSSLPSTSSSSTPVPPLSTFLHAYALVSSRAFQVSSYHLLALVPLADAFNHSDPPHVHLASDRWVCPECGKMEECPHDDGTVGLEVPESRIEQDATVDMVSERDIEAGEVFNTYGAGLSNAHLVAAYGFLLQGNEHDVVSFDRQSAAVILRNLSDPSGSTDGDDFRERYQTFYEAWRSALQTSASLIDGDHPLIAPTSPVIATSAHRPDPDWSIDADARISDALWLAIALLAWEAARRIADANSQSAQQVTERSAKRRRHGPPLAAGIITVQNVASLARAAAEAWLRMEAEQGVEHAGSDAEAVSADAAESPRDPDEAEALRLASVLVRGLCAARTEQQVEDARNMDACALYERVEETENRALRLAIEYLAGERLLLERVSAQWTFS